MANPHFVTEAVQLYIWKVIWSLPILSFSSNWKEIRTLLTILEVERGNGLGRITNRRLLYLTDNMVTYDIFRRGTSTSTPLWTLFLRIKLLELELSCHIQVICLRYHYD